MQIYKSSKSIKGIAGSFFMNTSPKEQSLFIQMIKQTSYDESKHIGSFVGGSKVTVKLSLWEVGNLLDCFRSNREYSAPHKSKSGITTLRFSPYFVSNKETGEKTQRGFGISVTKSNEGANESWLLPINFGEKNVIEQYLIVFLRQCFHFEISEEKKQFKSRQESRQKLDNTAIEAPLTVQTPDNQTEEQI